MTSVRDIYDFIDKIAPFDSQMDFDNSGMLVGNFDKGVKKCLICLDITKNVVDECKKINAELIVSHHPVIFHPIRNLYYDSIPYILARNDISAICAHTNLDVSKHGVNYCLFKILGLKDKGPLSFFKTYELGYCGFLENEISSIEFAKFVKERLNCSCVRFTNISEKIKKIAVCSGAGGSLISEACKKKCNALVTGEIKHSDILFANDNGVSIFDVGHFKSENVVIPHFVEILQKEFPVVEFVESYCCSDEIEFV